MHAEVGTAEDTLRHIVRDSCKENRNHDPPSLLPASFSRAMEGRAPTSSSRLFQLPDEILSLILQSMDVACLPNIALVNSDCLQWARSRQFCTVQLNYSHKSWQMCMKLAFEAKERSESYASLTTRPSLGACIRFIIVMAEPELILKSHTGFGDLNEEEQNARSGRGRAAQKVSDLIYEPLLTGLFAIGSTFPQLERLYWYHGNIPPSCWKTLALSNVRYLRIAGVSVDKIIHLDQYMHPDQPQPWPLQQLHLDFTWMSYDEISSAENVGGTAPLCASILRLCAPTLEKLTWDYVDSMATARGTDLPTLRTHPLHLQIEKDVIEAGYEEQWDFPMPKFPKLRVLLFSNCVDMKFNESTSLDPFLDAPLTVLMAHQTMTEAHHDSFRRCGCIRSLETFIWFGGYMPEAPPFDFLEANIQLRKLSMPRALPGEFLESKLLPLLSNSFCNLTSLNIHWKERSIPESALEMIGEITSLEQIQLNAGERPGREERYWKIDHRALRSNLAPLSRLKRVSFLRDSYQTHFPLPLEEPTPGVDRYYIDRLIDLREFNDPQEALVHFFSSTEARVPEFERQHRKRMLKKATKYSHVFPELEWIYFGQTFMTISRGPEVPGNAVALFPERNELYHELDPVFSYYTPR